MKLFNNPKKAVALIMLVILLFAAYKTEATEMELGATYTGEFNGGYGITIIERVFDGKMDIGVALISDQQWENVSVSNNGNFFLSYVATRPENWWIVLPTEVHIGASHWIKTQSPINGCHLGYLLGLKWRVTDHASIGIRHWSNAGTCKPNRGQDILTFGWRF